MNILYLDTETDKDFTLDDTLFYQRSLKMVQVLEENEENLTFHVFTEYNYNLTSFKDIPIIYHKLNEAKEFLKKHKKQEYVFVTFNSNFDLPKIFSYQFIREQKGQEKINFPEIKLWYRKIGKARFYTSKKLIDLMSIGNVLFNVTSLNGLSKIFGLEKLDNEEFNFENPNFISYALNDVWLYHQIYYFILDYKETLPFSEKLKLTDIYSYASFSKQLLNLLNFKNPKIKGLSENTIQQAYYGGWCDAYRIGEFKNMRYIDVKSEYATSGKYLLDDLLNAKELVFDRLPIQKAKFKLNELCGIIQKPYPTEFKDYRIICVVEPNGLTFMKHKGRFFNVYADKQILQVFWLYDLAILKTLFKTEFKIHFAYVLKPILRKDKLTVIDGITLNNVFSKLMELKDYAEEQNDNIKRWAYKIIVNALYGCFAQTKPRITKYTNFVLAGLITSLSRYILSVMRFNSYGFCYQDTDSVFTKTSLSKIKEKLNVLGFNVDIKGEGNIRIVGVKKYAIYKEKTISFCSEHGLSGIVIPNEKMRENGFRDYTKFIYHHLLFNNPDGNFNFVRRLTISSSKLSYDYGVKLGEFLFKNYKIKDEYNIYSEIENAFNSENCITFKDKMKNFIEKTDDKYLWTDKDGFRIPFSYSDILLRKE